MPVDGRHTGVNMANAIEDVLDAVFPDWKQRILSIASDGASANVGCNKGAVTELQNLDKVACSAKLSRTWCGLHQLDLLAKRLLHAIQTNDFLSTVISISAHLRRSQNFSKDEGKCPRYVERRWISLFGLLVWLNEKRTVVQEFLSTSKLLPDTQFWIIAGIVEDSLEPVDNTFKKLQGRDVTLEDLAPALEKLQDDFADVVGACLVVEGTGSQESVDNEKLNVTVAGSLREKTAKLWCAILSLWSKQAHESLDEHEEDEVLSLILDLQGGILRGMAKKLLPVLTSPKNSTG